MNNQLIVYNKYLKIVHVFTNPSIINNINVFKINNEIILQN